MTMAKIQNHSALPDWDVARWFHPRFLSEYVDRAIVLPDVCPAGIMPNGTVAVVRREWLDSFRFSDAIGDIGCAMSLAPIDTTFDDLVPAWNELYRRLKALDKTVLGSGNHFIDACVDEAGGLHVLVHVGSRMATEEKAAFRFAKDYKRFEDRAVANHDEIWQCVKAVLGGRQKPRSLPHDTVDLDGAWMILRKGVTNSPAGGDVLIASSFDDVITVGTAKASIHELGDSMSHGTGRKHGRGEAKEVPVDEQLLRRRIVIPDDLPSGSWRLEAPVHYRHSSEVVPLVDAHFDVTNRLTPVAFMGGF
ncbi:MAG: RtcB family protein [Planctomycetes bacterium]|nr:RtcB family protein [Planctomycetota bacterium]